MTNHDHERALELIMRRGTEDIAAARCGLAEVAPGKLRELRRLRRGLRPDRPSAALGCCDRQLRRWWRGRRQRVQRARLYLQEQQSRMVLIAISFCLGALSSATSAWLWWKFGGWVAERFGLPRLIVQPGILLFLLLPAVVIAGVDVGVPRARAGRTDSWPHWRGNAKEVTNERTIEFQARNRALFRQWHG